MTDQNPAAGEMDTLLEDAKKLADENASMLVGLLLTAAAVGLTASRV